MRVIRVVASVAVLGLLAGCQDQQPASPSGGPQLNAAAQKTVVCHKPGTPAEGTLEVATAAVQAHLDHGDVLGECGGGGPLDACTAINDPQLDGSGITSVVFPELVFVGDERVSLTVYNIAFDGTPFSLYVEAPEGAFHEADNSYWVPGAAYVHVELPDNLYPGPSGPFWGLGAWRSPTYFGWGTSDDSFIWEVACEHCPVPAECPVWSPNWP